MSYSMKKISNIIAEIVSASEKAEWYKEVANQSRHIFLTRIKNSNMLGFSYINGIPHWKIEKLLFWKKVKIRWESLGISIVRSVAFL